MIIENFRFEDGKSVNKFKKKKVPFQGVENEEDFF